MLQVMTTISAQIDVQLLDRPVQYVPLDEFPQPAGAECAFLGRTRDETDPEHGRLMRLSYECYQPLAEKTLRELADAAVAQYECLLVRVHHAVGEVPPGASSVLVQVVCGHRDSAFEACRFLIDSLKATAPIWKHEQWEDGATWARGVPVRRGDAGR